MLELAPKGFGFLRVPGKNFEQARDDVFVTPEIDPQLHLRLGQWIHGLYQDGPRGPQLVEVTTINGMTPEEASKLPHFDELKAINPTKRISPRNHARALHHPRGGHHGARRPRPARTHRLAAALRQDHPAPAHGGGQSARNTTTPST